MTLNVVLDHAEQMTTQTQDAEEQALREFTSQDVFFPRHYACSPETEHSDFTARLDDQLFEIRDDILYNCITYGEGLESTSLEGFTKTKDGVGYALLAFFASRALGLYRLPFCPDRAFKSLPTTHIEEQKLRGVLSQLTPERVDTICSELRALYSHTQRLLQKADLAHVRLKRKVTNVTSWYYPNAIGYAELLFKLKAACEFTGRSTLRFEMDVLNSYGDDCGYAHYPVAIVQTIPSKNILYFSNCIRNRQEGTGSVRNPAVEVGEWVVINRAPDGVVELPVTSIRLNTDDWIDQWGRQSMNRTDEEAFIAAHEPVVLHELATMRHETRYNGGGLRLRAKERLIFAFKLLSTGRTPLF